MLEQLRQNQRNVLIYIVFGIIIAAFVISFGPGGRSGGAGPVGASYVAKVAGTTISEKDLRVANQTVGPRWPQETVLDKLIERELFADEAERIGLRTSPKEAEDFIASGRILTLGFALKIESVMKEGAFDYEKFKSMMQNQLGVTPLRFVEIQEREILADRMREVLRANSKVLQEEVKADFEQKNLQVNLEFVRYSARRYEDELEPTAAEIDAYIKAHTDELKKQYDERAFLYKKLDKQARLRHVLVALPPTKDVAPAVIETAKKKAEALLAKIKGGASFATVARSDSDDERTKKRGGLMGWRKKDLTQLGKDLDEKLFGAAGAPGAKKGDIIGPEKTDRGFEIVLVEDWREGDVPLEAAEREMAEDAVRRQKALDKAHAEAQATFARLQKGEKFDAIVPKDVVEDDAHAGARAGGDAPKLAETGPYARRGDMVPDIGVSAELAKKVFDMKVGEVAGPYDVTNAAVVVRVKERKEPDLADYEKRKDELRRELERSKWKEVVDEWSKQRCIEYKTAGKIKINQEVLSGDDGAGTPAPAGRKKPPYEPCSTGPRLPF